MVGHGTKVDDRYRRFFECFNHEKFFEAHAVLEELWLPARGGERDRFYKGLIQLAGAFVHVQKGRRGPGVALLKLAAANLAGYPPMFHGLDLRRTRRVIEDWLGALERNGPGAWGPEPFGKDGIDQPQEKPLPKLRLRLGSQELEPVPPASAANQETKTS